MYRINILFQRGEIRKQIGVSSTKPNLNTEGEIVNSYSSASCCYHRMPEVINLYRERVYFWLTALQVLVYDQFVLLV